MLQVVAGNRRQEAPAAPPELISRLGYLAGMETPPKILFSIFKKNKSK